MKRIAIALCLLLLMPLSAWSSDLVATWLHKEGNMMKLSMRDNNHIRMDVTADHYMLVSGEKVYMVTGNDGQWTVMDMDQVAGVMNRFGGQSKSAVDEMGRYQSSFKKTGRTETIAGYKGSVYVAETKDETGKLIDSSEVVFSTHKDVKKASEAWMTLAMRMGTILGQDKSQEIDRAIKKAEKAGYGGMLRVGEMKLVSIERPSLSAAYYKLPAGAQMTDMSAIPGMGAGSGDSEEGTDFVKELGEEANKAAQEEVKQNTIDEVKKGVGGMFKKLFK